MNQMHRKPSQQCRKSLTNHTRKIDGMRQPTANDAHKSDHDDRISNPRRVSRKAPLNTTSERSCDAAEKTPRAVQTANVTALEKNRKSKNFLERNKKEVRLLQLVRCEHSELRPNILRRPTSAASEDHSISECDGPNLDPKEMRHGTHGNSKSNSATTTCNSVMESSDKQDTNKQTTDQTTDGMKTNARTRCIKNKFLQSRKNTDNPQRHGREMCHTSTVYCNVVSTGEAVRPRQTRRSPPS